MLFNGNQQPRKLSPGELAKLLEPFQIRPQTIRTFAAASGRPTLKESGAPRLYEMGFW
jgi:hypothetical protein